MFWVGLNWFFIYLVIYTKKLYFLRGNLYLVTVLLYFLRRNKFVSRSAPQVYTIHYTVVPFPVTSFNFTVYALYIYLVTAHFPLKAQFSRINAYFMNPIYIYEFCLKYILYIIYALT